MHKTFFPADWSGTRQVPEHMLHGTAYTCLTACSRRMQLQVAMQITIRTPRERQHLRH